MVLAKNKHCIFNLSYVDTVWPQVSSSGGRFSSTVSGLGEIHPRLYLGEIQLTAGLSLFAGSQGLSPTTMNITPRPTFVEK